MVLVLAEKEHSKYPGDRWFPLFQAGLVGVVAEDGGLRFPGLGRDEARFVDGIDTVSDLRAQSGRRGVRFDVGSRGPVEVTGRS